MTSIADTKQALRDKSLATLEFPKIQERLASFTSFPVGHDLALNLLPAWEPTEVVRRQQETREARRFLDLRPSLSLAEAKDVRPLAQRAMRDGVLEPPDLLDILATIAVGRTIKTTFSPLMERLPLLAELVQTIAPLSSLEAEITRCLNLRGEVLDRASPLLARIRQQAKIAHDRLLSKMTELHNSAAGRRAAQDPIVTFRDGRYVIPVKADFRGELRGIVHDVSSSGATLFIEPLAVVDLGNTWRELQAEEKKEIERILRQLSAAVGQDAEAILRNVDALAGIDLALAKARYGAALKGSEPTLGESAVIKLIDARHPLLPGPVVPISLDVGGDHPILVITGPNTGGKTVALKTVGLLSILAQAGIPIPAAPGCVLPVFDGIYADIGDEQSIEQSLSTFSSHMGNIIAILKEANPQSLVLLDELAAGTDPAEGSALARAVLSHLLERGCIAVATTHHSELKAFAHSTPGVRNARVEFDPETLAPTFKLSVGLPGRSNPLAIASRLGLPSEVLDAARALVPAGEVALDSLLAEVERQRGAAVAQQAALAQERSEAEHLQRLLRERLERIEEERQQAITSARREVEAEVEGLRVRMRQLAAELEGSVLDRQRLRAAAGELRSITEAVREARREWEAETITPELIPGVTVWMRGLNRLGELLTAPDPEGEVRVQLGSFTVKLHRDQVEARAEAVAETTAGGRRAPSFSLPPAPLVSLEHHLRGMRGDEAIESLDRYLNDAFLAGLVRVRIVHGKGTGTLRQLVREHLARHPLVKSYASVGPAEGGEGVTAAELAE